MMDHFFADYKKFIVVPEDEKKRNEVFDHKNYAAYYILTLSLFDPRVSCWRDAGKFEIDIDKSIETVLKDFNEKQRERYHLQLLEVDKEKNYFILALSSKVKFTSEEEKESISFIIDRILTNPFYVRQSWFNLIGEKGRIARKLFSCSFKEYVIEDSTNPNRDEKYENISEFPKPNGEIKLLKNPLKRDIL